MTLTVRAYYFDPQGLEHCIPIASDLAGVESARHNFYGSELALSGGATILPRLAEQASLRLGGPELRTLKAEVDMLRRAVMGRADQEYWMFRLANISAAIEGAEQHGSAGWIEIA
jgi:hypothetical protein